MLWILPPLAVPGRGVIRLSIPFVFQLLRKVPPVSGGTRSVFFTLSSESTPPTGMITISVTIRLAHILDRRIGNAKEVAKAGLMGVYSVELILCTRYPILPSGRISKVVVPDSPTLGTDSVLTTPCGWDLASPRNT